MRVVNGAVIPSYDPKLISAAIEFIQRADLKGVEAVACVETLRFLGAVKDGHYTIVEASAGSERSAND